MLSKEQERFPGLGVRKKAALRETIDFQPRLWKTLRQLQEKVGRYEVLFPKRTIEQTKQINRIPLSEREREREK